MERGLDPMTTNLVVADPERTDKTICLAVSPSMKALGVKNRCRVFEIPKGIDYIMAPPRMQKYIDYSCEIYGTYLNYISRDDIYVYSIDEVFMDITHYLKLYEKTPRELAVFLMDEVTKKVGVRATAGIGTNLYLTKIALDITAKHSPDFIGYLDEQLFIDTLWDHEPLRDFWRIGPGTERRLLERGITNMRGIANADETMLYRMFGIDAELLIDHAWGREPVTLQDIKKYRPETHSLSEGQVLKRDYRVEEARLILKEMVTELCLRLSKRRLVCQSFTINLVYSRKLGVPVEAATAQFGVPTNAETIILRQVLSTYDLMVIPEFTIRGIYLSANNTQEDVGEIQLNMFEECAPEIMDRDGRIQDAMLAIKDKYGKNAMFKARDLEEGATTLERNMQIGGHKSGKETGE